MRLKTQAICFFCEVITCNLILSSRKMIYFCLGLIIPEWKCKENISNKSIKVIK